MKILSILRQVQHRMWSRFNLRVKIRLEIYLKKSVCYFEFYKSIVHLKLYLSLLAIEITRVEHKINVHKMNIN